MCDNFDNVYKEMIPIQPVFEALVRRRKMETSVCTPLMNSCIERFPSWFLSIFMKISFVFSSAERPPFWDSLVILYMAFKISVISCSVMYPSLSKSYILKASFALVSSVPREVIPTAQMNSRKSSFPSRFSSNARKTCSANFSAFPCGKSFLYILRNSSMESSPVGHSNKNPLYHSRSSASLKLVCVFRSSNVSGFSLLLCFPIVLHECPLLVYDYSLISQVLFIYSPCCLD